jgi:hypothetical protein
MARSYKGIRNVTDTTLINDLVTAGLAPELVHRVAVQLGHLEAEREAAERRRAKGAARVRQYRARHVTLQERDVTLQEPCNVTSPNVALQNAKPLENNDISVTLHHVTASRAPAPLTSFLPNLLSKEESKKERKKEGVSNRGERLSADWQPNFAHYAEAAKSGQSAAWVDRLADDMRVWAEANANRQIARKANWDQTFTGWLRREIRKLSPGDHNGTHLGPTARAARALIAELRAKEAAEAMGTVRAEHRR